MSITTPTTAVRARELTASQREAVRLGYIINDFPYQPDRTYVVFDADVGDNDLHLATGASSNYSISKGDGTDKTSYNDTGGTKTLNYAVAGRYLITIDGNFNGFLMGATGTLPLADREKYIEFILGSNHPTTIANYEFNELPNLVNIKLPFVTAIGDQGIRLASSLKSIDLSGVTSLGDASLFNCSMLVNLNIPDVTTIGVSALNNCVRLEKIYAPSLITIGANAFVNSTKIKTYQTTYSASLSIGTAAFDTIELADLIVDGANGTQATEVETKFTTASGAQANGYRLIY